MGNIISYASTILHDKRGGAEYYNLRVRRTYERALNDVWDGILGYQKLTLNPTESGLMAYLQRKFNAGSQLNLQEGNFGVVFEGFLDEVINRYRAGDRKKAAIRRNAIKSRRRKKILSQSQRGLPIG